LRKKRRRGFLSGLSTGLVVLARMDIMASDGGSRTGEEETVIVMSERRTLVNGSTAKGAGWAIFAG
jgi:hypothetical protein